MIPLRSADGALTGAAGALLLPRLDAAAAHFGAGEGGLGALALIRQIGRYYAVQHGLVYFLSEYFFAQLDLADLFAGNIVQCNVRH